MHPAVGHRSGSPLETLANTGQLAAFLDLLHSGDAGALATAEDGLIAVRIADRASRWRWRSED